MKIRYLRHDAIDKARWDAALALCPNGKIYASTLYLDHMSPGWDALVQGDYEALFPLPWRRKWGIHYVYPPFLTAQLGLFAPAPSAQQLTAFEAAIPAHFRLVELPLNEGNFFNEEKVTARSNYALPLNEPYETLLAAYRDNIRRNIRKARQYGCRSETGTPLPEIISLARTHARDQAGLGAFTRLHQELDARGQVRRYGVRSAEGQLLASAVFLLDARRAYYILVGNHPNGRTLGASHLLIDSFIADHAGSGLLLDFEGSDLRNLAFFYSSFGARQELYPQWRIDRLPWWIRLVKS
ncbi:MAG: GNAT family N-acetyltransferase [Chitinophagaceae bacterium]|nr:MAG: GNAT family N-acetyltransferase [Chitinophagaceae bacterium]